MYESYGAMGLMTVVGLGVEMPGMVSRLPRRTQWMVYALCLLVTACLGLTRMFASLHFVPPFSVLTAGRAEFALLGLTGPTLIGVPGSVMAKESSRRALDLLGRGVVAYSLFHFVCPLTMSPWYQGLETRINGHGIRFQSTAFTCGPAAAVTALNRLGIEAEEGELAAAAFTTPLFGTAPDQLGEAIRRRYGDDVECEYRPLEELAGIGKGVMVVTILKYNPMLGHYVALLKREGGQVVLGDPSYGLERMSADEFQADWSGSGIVIRKKEPGE